MKIIECPRDAMQGKEKFIPTLVKAEYINLLLKAGFDTIDFGSFVSHKAVPQMKDTANVLAKLDLSETQSKLLAIVVNVKGAGAAVEFDEIHYLGFPLSISETFQLRNTKKTIAESLNIVEEIQNMCTASGKELVVYLSMGFGNPYGDPYNVDIVQQFSGILAAIGIHTISLADTIGVSDNENITYLFSSLTSEYPGIEFGAHLHSNSHTAYQKIEAAFNAGCRRFDGAISGYGGCPFAEDILIGNIATELFIDLAVKKGYKTGINKTVFAECIQMASNVFSL